MPAPRADLSKYAPRIVSFRIHPDKIREVIGAGGKIINEIIAACFVAIDIEDDGLVAITGSDPEGVKRAVEWVNGIVKDVEIGEVYEGKVTRLMDFGAFVEILPNKEGMVHISEFSNQRVNDINDVAKIGDTLKVKVIEVDDKGRINLSVKKADPNYNPEDDQRGLPPRSRPGNGGGFRNDRHGGFQRR